MSSEEKEDSIPAHAVITVGLKGYYFSNSFQTKAAAP